MSIDTKLFSFFVYLFIYPLRPVDMIRDACKIIKNKLTNENHRIGIPTVIAEQKESQATIGM